MQSAKEHKIYSPACSHSFCFALNTTFTAPIAITAVVAISQVNMPRKKINSNTVNTPTNKNAISKPLFNFIKSSFLICEKP